MSVTLVSEGAALPTLAVVLSGRLRKSLR